MYNIIEHIEFLMMTHDCVVIPGWGALVAQYSESHYNPVGQRIERPQRQLGFNASVNHNDGLLAQSIVRRQRVSYDQAMHLIGQHVRLLRQQIEQGQEVSMGRLGYFHGLKGHVEFTPFYHDRSNDDYYGLRSLQMQPLDSRRQSGEAARPASRPAAWRGQYLRIAASILALICLTVLLTTPIMFNNSDRRQYASLNPPTISKPQRQAIDCTATQPAPVAVAAADQASTGVDTSGLLLNEGGNYYLVIASFTSRDQAEKYMTMQPDLDGKMQIEQANSRLFHVYVARSHDPQHLYALRTQISDRHADAWVNH